VFIYFFSIDLISFVLMLLNLSVNGYALATTPFRRRVEILRFPLLWSACFVWKTFDDIDNTPPSQKFSDGGPDSPRLAWHHREIFFLVSIVIPFIVGF